MAGVSSRWEALQRLNVPDINILREHLHENHGWESSISELVSPCLLAHAPLHAALCL